MATKDYKGITMADYIPERGGELVAGITRLADAILEEDAVGTKESNEFLDKLTEAYYYAKTVIEE